MVENVSQRGIVPTLGRTDARRNRERLIEVARAAFTSSPVPVPLEHIAREAGVGIATLYRNFPTREALVEEVYAAELDELCASADVLLSSFSPDEALRVWARRYASFIAGKKGMLESLRAGWATGRATTTSQRLNAAVSPILVAGARAGLFRRDIPVDDVTTLLLGISTMYTEFGGKTQRLLDFVIDGLTINHRNSGEASH